jgi:tetratricopeptide (TPR) repeat protein
MSGATFTPHTRPGAVVNREKEGQAADLNSQAGRLLEAGDTNRAIQLFQQAVALLPANETLHYNLAIAFALAGDPTNAEHEYKEALRLLPDYPEAHQKYGDLLVRLGRLPEAEEHLAEAVEQMPDVAQVQNSLGVARQRRNKTNEALLCFQKAIACDSNCWEAHYNLALAYLNRKNREKEIAELRQTLRINPGFELAQRALARALAQETPKPPAAATTPK